MNLDLNFGIIIGQIKTINKTIQKEVKGFSNVI